MLRILYSSGIGSEGFGWFLCFVVKRLPEQSSGGYIVYQALRRRVRD